MNSIPLSLARPTLVIAAALVFNIGGTASSAPLTKAVSPTTATSVSPSRSLKYPIDGPVGGVESAYAPLLTRWIRSGPPAFVAELGKDAAVKADGNPVRMLAVETPGSRFYIGLIHQMRVAAPIEKVASVIDDFAHYQELFSDFDDIHVIARDGNKVRTFWEQHIPVFFVKNVKYEILYLIDDSRIDRRIYRYQLAVTSNIKKNDGMIVLEADGTGTTRYTEYDFFDADWGPLTTFAPGRIWKDSVEGMYLSDLAIQQKAEHPDWSYKKISIECRKFLDRYPVDEVIEQKKILLNNEAAAAIPVVERSSAPSGASLPLQTDEAPKK